MKKPTRQRSGRVSGWIALATACTILSAAHATEPADPKSGSIAAALTSLRLPDLDGTPVALGDYLGKGPLVLDFWATWCKPCLAALPELEKLAADLGPRGLQVVGVNEDGQRNAAKVKPFVRTRGIRFPIVLDLNREAQQRLNVPNLPTTLLVDRDGVVVHASFSYRPGEIEALRARIEALLDAEPEK